MFNFQATLAFSCCHPASHKLLFLNTKTVSAKLSLCVCSVAPYSRSKAISSPQHRHAGQPRKIHKESNLGCDHNEKAANAQICRETPLIPKVRSSSTWQQEEQSHCYHSYQFMQISQQSSLNQAFRDSFGDRLSLGGCTLLQANARSLCQLLQQTEAGL